MVMIIVTKAWRLRGEIRDDCHPGGAAEVP
jgi:hypothetical protein